MCECLKSKLKKKTTTIKKTSPKNQYVKKTKHAKKAKKHQLFWKKEEQDKPEKIIMFSDI